MLVKGGFFLGLEVVFGACAWCSSQIMSNRDYFDMYWSHCRSIDILVDFLVSHT